MWGVLEASPGPAGSPLSRGSLPPRTPRAGPEPQIPGREVWTQAPYSVSTGIALQPEASWSPETPALSPA